MTAISFSVMKDKLLDGTKCQTIRKLRKRPVKVGDKIIVYWNQRSKNNEILGITECIEEKAIDLKDVTLEDAEADGFCGRQHLWDWFNAHYSTDEVLYGKWQIIKFKPLKDSL